MRFIWMGVSRGINMTPIMLGKNDGLEKITVLGKVAGIDRKSTRLNSSHVRISYAVFCLKKKKNVTQVPDEIGLIDRNDYRYKVYEGVSFVAESVSATGARSDYAWQLSEILSNRGVHFG